MTVRPSSSIWAWIFVEGLSVTIGALVPFGLAVLLSKAFFDSPSLSGGGPWALGAGFVLTFALGIRPAWRAIRGLQEPAVSLRVIWTGLCAGAIVMCLPSAGILLGTAAVTHAVRVSEAADQR